MIRPNRIKTAIEEGRVATGISLCFPSVHAIEILGRFDFDFVWLDGEHGPFGLGEIEDMCRVAELHGMTPIARVPNIESSTILGYLDRGIQGILGPHIASRADAEQLVRACQFGPRGERSFGGNRGCHYNHGLGDMAAWFRETNDNILIGALLEDAGVVENLDEILSVDGIDYFSVGPNDFAQGLGHPGGAALPEVEELIAEVHDRIRAAGCRIGTDITRRLDIKDALIGLGTQFFSS